MLYFMLLSVEEKIPKIRFRVHCKKLLSMALVLFIHENNVKTLETQSQQCDWSFSSEGGKSIKLQYKKERIPEIK